MEKPHYTIRDAVATDARAITKMHADSWRATYPNESAGVSREWVEAKVAKWFTDEGLEIKRQRTHEAARTNDMLYRVAEDESGEIVGMINPFRDEEVQRVGALYVAKEHHGTGLAQKLMDEIIAWADPQRPLELEVASYNERAKAFYRKYGFREVDGSAHLVHEVIPVVTMIRKGDKQ